MTQNITQAERMDVQETLEKLIALPKSQRLIAVGVIQGMALSQETKENNTDETA